MVPGAESRIPGKQLIARSIFCAFSSGTIDCTNTILPFSPFVVVRTHPPGKRVDRIRPSSAFGQQPLPVSLVVRGGCGVCTGWIPPEHEEPHEPDHQGAQDRPADTL